MLQRPAAVLSSTPEQLRKRARRAWLLFAAIALVIVATALTGAGLYARRAEVATLAAQGRTDANLKVALLRAVLESPRALPLLLSEDQQVHDALQNKGAAAIDVLNRKLEGLVSGTKASVLYVTGVDGFAIASSNWREPTSFVGNDYWFPRLFLRRHAIRNGRIFRARQRQQAPRPLHFAARRQCGGTARRRRRQDGVRPARSRLARGQPPGLCQRRPWRRADHQRAVLALHDDRAAGRTGGCRHPRAASNSAMRR